MKKTLFLPLIIFTTIFFCAMECEPEETCKQDEICEAKAVSACCTEDVCIWKYNEKEYTEEQLGELAIELGCSTASLKSSDNQELTTVIEQLKALMEKARIK